MTISIGPGITIGSGIKVNEPVSAGGGAPSMPPGPYPAVPTGYSLATFNTDTNTLIATYTSGNGTLSTYYSLTLGDASWTARTLPQAYVYNAYNFVYLKGYYYAFTIMGSGPSIYTRDIYRSADLSSWTKVWSSGLNANWAITINSTTGYMLATCGFNRTAAATSTDGVNWTPVTLSASSSINYRNAWNSSTIIAPNYGNTTDYLYRSANNGSTWTSVANTSNWASSGQYVTDAAYGNGRFVAFVSQGNNQTSVSTDDGVTWSALGTRSFNGGAYAVTMAFNSTKNKFIIPMYTLGNTPPWYVNTSTDGINWTETTLPSQYTKVTVFLNQIFGQTATTLEEISSLIT